MAQVSITGEKLGAVVDRAQTIVQVKSAWADDWQTVSYLEAVSATACVSPSMPKATLLYRYGNIIREDDTSFQQYDPLFITNRYVRIQAIDGLGIWTVWTGIILDDSFNMHGAESDPQGDQAITAYGLEILLDRVAIEGAYTDDGKIDWCPPFNSRDAYGAALQGNRATDLDAGETSHRFSKDGQTWTHYDIINYLLDRYFGLQILISGQKEILEQMSGVYYFEGLSLKQAFDKLIDRRRGIGWFLDPGEGDGTISLIIFSVFSDPVSAGSITFSGNPSVSSLDLSAAFDVDENLTRIVQSSLYDRIVIQGSRIKTCFTVSVAAGNLVRDWTTAAQTAYNTKTEDTARASEKYEHVYQQFKIPDDWNWTHNDGTGDRISVLPEWVTAATWNNDRPLLRWIPIEKPNGGYEEPMVFVTSEEKIYMVDKLSAVKKPGAHTRIMDTGKGFSLKGKINHLFGLNHFSGTSETDPQYDYTTLAATLAVESDARIKEVVELGGETEIPRTLVIPVYDAEYWHIARGTAKSLENGTIVYATQDITVRDDRDKLKKIAALARAWYSVYRSAVRVTVRFIGMLAPLGGVISDISGSWHKEPVNTVVTSRTWDFTSGTTTIETGYTDLDIRAMLDVPGMSDFRAVGRAFNRHQSEIGELKQRVGSLPSRISETEGSIPVKMQITEIKETYLICDYSGTSIKVAKPWAIRMGVDFPSGPAYVYNSATHRTATQGATVEEQYITPAYGIGEEITAASTGFEVLKDVDGNIITWIDINTAGRSWAT